MLKFVTSGNLNGLIPAYYLCPEQGDAQTFEYIGIKQRKILTNLYCE